MSVSKVQIEKDDSKGLKFDNSFKIGVTNFGVESS